MAESSPIGLKTLWEKEKLLITSNFSFSHSVLKRLVLQTHKNQGLFGIGLKTNEQHCWVNSVESNCTRNFLHRCSFEESHSYPAPTCGPCKTFSSTNTVTRECLHLFGCGSGISFIMLLCV